MSSVSEPDSLAVLDLSPESFGRFASYIKGELGIKMPSSKVPMLQSRLMRRLRTLRLQSLDEYLEYLFNSPGAAEEQIQFINAVTTNKTDFFREPRHFEFLTSTALPSLDPGLQHRWDFKLWCAGCSSGEEPYTLSMVLSEFGTTRRSFDFRILATDISTRVLDHARLGIYSEERAEPVEAALRSRYLLRSKDRSVRRIRIKPQLRQRVSFHRLNFMDEFYPVKDLFEVIFFRNVMIYFDKPTQEAVINKLCRNLVPGGFLFVGHSESLAGLRIPVEQVSSAVFRKPH